MPSSTSWKSETLFQPLMPINKIFQCSIDTILVLFFVIFFFRTCYNLPQNSNPLWQPIKLFLYIMFVARKYVIEVFKIITYYFYANKLNKLFYVTFEMAIRDLIIGFWFINQNLLILPRRQIIPLFSYIYISWWLIYYRHPIRLFYTFNKISSLSSDIFTKILITKI